MSETLRSTIEDEAPVETITEKVPRGIRGTIAEYAGDGTLALAVGAVGLGAGLRRLRSNPVGGLLRVLSGGVWIAVGLTQRRRDSSEREDAGFDDLGDVTPGETDDDMAAKNTLPPTDVGQPQAQDVGLSDEAETTNEPADVAGPQDEHAAPAKDKTSVPGEPPTDDVSMVGDDSEDEGTTTFGATDEDEDVSTVGSDDDGGSSAFGSDSDDDTATFGSDDESDEEGTTFGTDSDDEDDER